MYHIKKSFLFLPVLILVLFYGKSYSQVYPYIVWNKVYNASSNLQDSAVEISKNSSGMLFVTGWSLGSTGNKDLVTIRYNPLSGDTLWVKRYESTGNDVPEDLTCDNNFAYVTGWVLTGAVRDVLTIKFNAATGDTAWVRKFNGPGNGGDYGKGIAVDNNGNAFVCGRTDVGGAQKYLILKYSSSCALDTFIYRGPLSSTFDEAHYIICDNSGNIYITGTSGQTSTADVLTLKLSTNPLTLLWAKKHTSPGAVEDNGIRVRLDNSQSNLFVGGWGRNAVQDYFIIKYNASTGDSLAYAYYNGPTGGSDILTEMIVDQSNNVIATGGSVNNPVIRYEYATVKWNSDLVQQWAARTTNPDGWDFASDLNVGTGNDLYVTGYRTKASQGTNLYTIRYNLATGDTVWTKMENGTANQNDYAIGIVVMDSSRIFVTGSAVFSPLTTASIYTLRYSNEIVGIRPISTEIPVKFNVSQNYPNPFNPTTSIRFDVPKESFVKITVFDVMGREIEILANEKVKPGEYEAQWDASKYASGIYFYQIQAGDYNDSKKMILAK